MEPNNIEKLIQDNFKDRSIEPSEQARERLIVALNTKPKRKKKIWLSFAIAASFVLGLLFTGGRLLLKNDMNEQPTEISFEKETQKIEQQITPKEAQKPEVIVLNESQDSNNENNISKQSIIVSNSNEKSSQNSIVEQNSQTFKDNELPIGIPENDILTNDLVTTKETENIATVEPPKQFQYITGEELLQITTTDNTIELRKNIKKESKSYLEPDALLVEMEKDLFDEKNKSIFKKARKQLKEFKEAVANRNYEPNH